MPAWDREELRARLREARLMLIFSPHLCPRPEEVLERVLPAADILQVRVKEGPDARSSAAENERWCRLALELARSHARPPLVIQNDRLDVALALVSEGLAGIHLGAEDCPPREARRLLGEVPLIGLSTHGPRDVVRAEEEPVDYLGFGPVFATSTKGYGKGLGAEAAWVAHNGSSRPVFPIGGIGRENVGELREVGRVAVASAVLDSEDPLGTLTDLGDLLRG